MLARAGSKATDIQGRHAISYTIGNRAKETHRQAPVNTTTAGERLCVSRMTENWLSSICLT